MRFRHAVAGLRLDAVIQQFPDKLAGRLGAGNPKTRDGAGRAAAGDPQFLDQIQRVGGHAVNERCPGPGQVSQQGFLSCVLAQDDLATGIKRGNHGAEPQVVAQRAQGIDDRGPVKAPVRGQRAGIGQQGVVAVHNAFGLGGGAGGQSQVNQAVWVGLYGRLPCFRQVIKVAENRVVGIITVHGWQDMMHGRMRPARQLAAQVPLLPIRAVTCLRDQQRRLKTR